MCNSPLLRKLRVCARDTPFYIVGIRIFSDLATHQLSVIQLKVGAPLGHELVVSAALLDAPVGNHHDLITALDGGKAVRNDKGGPSLEHPIQSLLYQSFRLGVDRGGCLVQNKDLGIRNQGSGNGNQLPLSLRQTAASFMDFRLIALVQMANKFIGHNGLTGRIYLFIRGIQLTILDILHDSAGKEEAVLQLSLIHI